MEDGAVVQSQGKLYPVELRVGITRSMRARLEAAAERDEISIAAAVRVGLNRWLASQEKRTTA